MMPIIICFLWVISKKEFRTYFPTDSKIYLIQYSVTQHKLPAYDPQL